MIVRLQFFFYYSDELHTFLIARKRHLSRIAAMQALFERESRQCDPHESLRLNQLELGQCDVEFSEKLLNGVLDNEQDIKAMLLKHAPDWSLERMDPIARCTLMVGSYELLIAEDAPPAVVMNEAIDIAKEYGTTESGKFVNGVLNAVAHRSK